MSNMSYCRWRNTLNDLQDCAQDLEARINAPEEFAPLSPEELHACERLLELASMMLHAAGCDVDGDPDISILKASS